MYKSKFVYILAHIMYGSTSRSPFQCVRVSPSFELYCPDTNGDEVCVYGCKPTKCYVCRVPITYGAREWVLVCGVRVWDGSTGYIEVQAKIRFLRNNTGGGSRNPIVTRNIFCATSIKRTTQK